METVHHCIGCDVDFDDEDDVRWFGHNNVPWMFRRFTGDASGTYCRECIDDCMACGWSIGSDDTYHCPTSGDVLCSDCYSERWMYCDGCGGEYSSELMQYNDHYGCWECESCHEPEGEALTVERCGTCGTDNVHFHLLTERFLCDCNAATQPARFIIRYNAPVTV